MENSLEALFYPKAIALFGASRTPGKVGHDILANLIGGGFAGPIVAVNPNAEEVLGLKCHPKAATCGTKIDLGIVVVPRNFVLDAVRDAAEAGARAVVVITAGFKETGGEGRDLERKLADFCRSREIIMLGPNCLGLINTDNRMNAAFAGAMPVAGGISVISQSGALCSSIIDLAAGRRLGIGKMVSIGNKADLNEADFLVALSRDPQTKVIVAYLEDITSGDDFVKAATEASSVKPVIMLKSGTTNAGKRAASSHTGVLSGAEITYGAAFKRSGVIRADSFEALFDYACAFAMQPLPSGKRTLIITNAGGPGTMAADAVEHSGLTVAELGRNTATGLRSRLPHSASIGNPIDVLGDADPERYAAALQAAQDDAEVDSIIVILTPQAMTRPAETARVIAANLTGNKPVLAAFMGGQAIMPGRDELGARGLPDYPSPERAVAALRAMCDYHAWRQRPPRIVTRFRVNRRRVERIITRSLRTNRLQVSEVKAKSILQAYGFQTPEGYLAGKADEAIEIAERIGYPVAMKIVSPDIIHKSDLGGVRLNVANSEAVMDAFDLMMMRIGQKAPNAWIEGVYVEKMLDRGLEVIVGMNRDPQFGPMLMFGLGGIFVEVMKDVAFHLAPITEDEAVQMLRATRSYGILEGKRGKKGVDLYAIAVALQRLSQLTTDFPQIAELDINPLIVGEAGMEPVVADARMTLVEVGTGGKI